MYRNYKQKCIQIKRIHKNTTHGELQNSKYFRYLGEQLKHHQQQQQ